MHFKKIGSKLVLSYISIVLIIVSMFEAFLIIGIKRYYYKNLEEALKRQAEQDINYYINKITTTNFTTASEDLLKRHIDKYPSQLQIIDASGRVIKDSAIYSLDKLLNYPDIKRALSGLNFTWVGINNETNEKVMTASYPIQYGGRVVGVIRVLSTLEMTDNTIKKITFSLLLLGFIILIITFAVSYGISKNLTKPINNLTASAMKMAAGNYKIRTDIKNKDEIGQLGSAFNHLADELNRHENLKNEFLSSISHELKTPLTSIIGWTATLKSSPLDNTEEIQNGLYYIEEECIRLTEMVEELLDFSRLQSGNQKLNIDNNDLVEIINYIHHYMAPRAYRQNIELTSEYDKPIINIQCDPDRIKQVFINLIDNSIKFTPAGGSIKLYAQCFDKYVLISVKDTGCGISPDDLPRITEKFYKGKNGRKGTGIGLSLCQDIISLHGGTMEIESTPEVGTSIYIKIPH